MQWLMLQQKAPEDLCISSGVQKSGRDFVSAVASVADMDIRWVGSGMDEKGFWSNGTLEGVVVAIDPRYFRPTEVENFVM